MNKALIFLTSLLMFSTNTYAEGEMDGWYTAKNGSYLVQEMIYGYGYAELANSMNNKPHIYMFFFDPEGCKKIGTEILTHNPIYINKKLVRFSQNCVDDRHMFYATTDEGNDYIIKQFLKSDVVEYRPYDSEIKYLFSAKNFKEIFTHFIDQDSGI